MQNRIEITEADLQNDRLVLTSDLKDGEQRKPAGRMLADSDHFAFVYILEQGDSFQYVMLDERIWSDMKSALDQHIPVFLIIGDRQLELIGLHDELRYLIENIKDNANYGEEMEERVKRVFL
ncbi:hypothetical protein [Bacillus sonorensis]|uniref:UPF0738 family protein n=1 Tax=Bacillus sonorensis TaxID=119858 RepID=UPI002280543F|nr:hypothetical protein [Bacillus sonorensis]MCY7855704.1 hypothetical protein [Bacillus sonorensis]MCY8087279.1 hypothetical protein [Bacillus sonorensis]MCY8405299.1 hypothetical protein [Bacillus sonorensis]MEC1440893.1 hypothetical protein [Bacillus sonorensis]MEC1501656.1 hypothetical protein [Bacillus sonorensis]